MEDAPEWDVSEGNSVYAIDQNEPKTALILALAKNERTLKLLQGFLRTEHHRISTVWSVSEFERLLDELATLDLTIMDIDGFSPEVWSVCERVAGHDVPILVLTSRDSARARQEALGRGVQLVLEKPIKKDELRSTIKALLE